MKGFQAITGSDVSKDQRWSKGIVLSVLFHLLIFSLILFVPNSIPTRKISGATIYEVNLVEMPTRSRTVAPRASVEKPGKQISSSKSSPTAKRIRQPAQKEKPVVIGKRVVKRKKSKKKKAIKPPKPKVSPSRLIDRAVSKIEKKVKANKDDHLARAISQIETRARGTDDKVSVRGGAENGITIRMYQLAVEEQIKGNWSYPVALMDRKKLKELEAIVLVKVKEDGTILKSWFKKQSSSSVFDGSVLKAIERSDPLPPFPEGYRRSYDEIEIKFDLSEMEEF